MLTIYRFKNKGRFLQLLLLCSMLFFSIAFPAYAAEKSGVCGENLRWTLSDGTLKISGHGDMMDYADGSLAPWFGVANTIQTIELSAGMTSVGDYAFFGCTRVTDLVIPVNVTEVGECAFAKCSSLVNLDMGTGVKSLGIGAFQECESLTQLSFPESLTEIGEKAFYRCYGLTEVYVPNTVTVMGASVFSYCTSLVQAVIDAPIEELPGWTFYGCSNLEHVTLAPEIVSEGEYAYLFCDKLNEDEQVSDIIYEPYDAELGESHLVDEDGTTYYVTGRSSKWGITGKQFAIYVGLWIASAVLIVAVVMMSINQAKRSKEHYEELVRQGEAQDAAKKENN